MMFFWGEFVHWGIYNLQQINPFQSSKITHNYLIFLFYHRFWFTFSLFQNSQSRCLIILRLFCSKRWISLREVLAIEATTAWNRGIPCKTLKITHNYLICLFYDHFLVHFLIISISTELISDYIEVYLE